MFKGKSKKIIISLLLTGMIFGTIDSDIAYASKIPSSDIRNFKKGLKSYKLKRYKAANFYFSRCNWIKDEPCIRRMSRKQKNLYMRLVKRYAKYDDISANTLRGYYLTDIDKDGIPELILCLGGDEVLRKDIYYTYKNGKLKKLGTREGFHTKLRYNPLGKGVYEQRTISGAEETKLITVRNGRLTEKLIVSRQASWYSERYVEFPYTLSKHNYRSIKYRKNMISYKPFK